MCGVLKVILGLICPAGHSSSGGESWCSVDDPQTRPRSHLPNIIILDPAWPFADGRWIVMNHEKGLDYHPPSPPASGYNKRIWVVIYYYWAWVDFRLLLPSSIWMCQFQTLVGREEKKTTLPPPLLFSLLLLLWGIPCGLDSRGAGREGGKGTHYSSNCASFRSICESKFTGTGEGHILTQPAALLSLGCSLPPPLPRYNPNPVYALPS
ncbi:hypothetical protein B0O99DRAFT_152613 [Bisporella sp. PMI_857]|nr:hypothetical protein B0O99DRAFT_152613 [Bisporella sp. PMI_857]